MFARSKAERMDSWTSTEHDALLRVSHLIHLGAICGSHVADHVLICIGHINSVTITMSDGLPMDAARLATKLAACSALSRVSTVTHTEAPQTYHINAENF